MTRSSHAGYRFLHVEEAVSSNRSHGSHGNSHRQAGRDPHGAPHHASCPQGALPTCPRTVQSVLTTLFASCLCSLLYRELSRWPLPSAAMSCCHIHLMMLSVPFQGYQVCEHMLLALWASFRCPTPWLSVSCCQICQHHKKCLLCQTYARAALTRSA